MIELYNKSYIEDPYPIGLTITDPPYNQNYHYNSYRDKLSEDEYIKLLSHIKRPCVIIHYPEETINIFPKIWGHCDEVVSWVYPSNTGKMFRLISFWGCTPDFKKGGQPYRNPTDKRVQKLIAQGKQCRLYDWWEINQVKNVSKEKTAHPCQIPQELIKRIIQITAQPGQTIIDPFAGSGTTLAVAKELGYSAIGYEIDSAYYQIALDRIGAVG